MLYTSLEQSQQLIDLGLDQFTSDFQLDYPSWSLTRLIEISTSLHTDRFVCKATSQPNQHRFINYEQEFDDIKHQELEKKSMESAVNLLSWLLSNHYVKK